MAYTDIDKPSDYFETKLYTGNDANNREISLGLTPDLTWIKARNVAYSHILFDRIRGLGFSLNSNGTNADRNVGSEFSWSNSGCTTDSFTVDRGSNESLNESGRPMVAWNWKAGGTASSNTDGSITSSVSANTTAGFSIVSYTGNNTDGATVGHGLGVIPSMVITKSRSTASLTGWMTKHKDLTSNYNLILNGTDSAWNPSSNGWVGDLNSSTTFSLENGSTNGNNANQNTITYIAYCFAEKKGYSKFGSYTGNGNADGTFVYTGFKPAFVIIKPYTDAGYTWNIYDNKRDSDNVVSQVLTANTSSAEITSSNNTLDFLSNGFKCRATDGNTNGSGFGYIYMAFAENPFVTSTKIPTTAR